MSDQQVDQSSAGVRFPFISLEKAIGRAQELYDADPKGREMSVAAAFNVWKYSEKSSGGFQTIAALKMYGLLKSASVGDGRKIALTDEALRYFRDEREEERQKHIREFALKPKLIAVLWRDWHASPPADAIARSHLKADRQLSDQGARSLLAIYKENLTLAKLTGQDKIQTPATTEAEADTDDTPGSRDQQAIEVGDIIQWEGSDGTLKLEKPARVRAIRLHDGRNWVFIDGEKTGIPMEQAILEKKGQRPSEPIIPPILAEEESASARPGVRKEVFALDEGDVTLVFPENLSAESFADLKSYLEVFLRKAQRRAGAGGSLRESDQDR